jgi:hypothetical protein
LTNAIRGTSTLRDCNRFRRWNIKLRLSVERHDAEATLIWYLGPALLPILERLFLGCAIGCDHAKACKLILLLPLG